MKMKKIEQWLLLEASGELSPHQLLRLGRELAASEAARMLRQELGQLRGTILPPAIEPSPWTVARISARLREERHPALTIVTRAAKPVLALAACWALVAGILIFHEKQISSASVAVVAAADMWNDSLEEDMSRLESQIMAISGDSLDTMEM